jgi:hypothetical protein
LVQSCHHDLLDLAVEGYLNWPLWVGATTVVVLISQKKPYRGVVKCQTIIFMQIFSNLVERLSIKYP